MEHEDSRKLLGELSRLFLSSEMTGRAYARLAEGLIALSALEAVDPYLEEFNQPLASYSPLGGEGLFGDAELRRLVQCLLATLQAESR